jgi:hypothetical protein
VETELPHVTAFGLDVDIELIEVPVKELVRVALVLELRFSSTWATNRVRARSASLAAVGPAAMVSVR